VWAAEITVDIQNTGGLGFEVGDDVALTWAVADSLVLGS
jgi:hypothetical protein